MGILDHKNYIADIPFMFSNYIYEYDIRKANISILYHKGIIDSELYNYLLKAPRDVRQYTIGNLQKDIKVNKALADGILEAKSWLFGANAIEERDVLSIKNDAVFLINKLCKTTKFDNIDFILKNTYTSFIKLGNLEVYYGLNITNGTETIDVKGINDTKLSMYHQEYFIQILCEIFYSLQTDRIENTIILFKDIYNKYINRAYPIGYYREFSADSVYRISNPNNIMGYKCTEADEMYKSQVNISYNLKLLMQLYGYISSIYFNRV